MFKWKKIVPVVLIIDYTGCQESSVRFNNLWKIMQQEYQMLNILEPQDSHTQMLFCHPLWQRTRKEIKKIITGIPDKNLLKNKYLSGTMVRNKNDRFQQYEIDFINYCINEVNKNLLTAVKDTSFGQLEKISQEFQFSPNSLGHLFYVGKILENVDYSAIHTIVEFGGGYGNLARILKQIFPQSTIFLIDLPELLVIQGLFLRETLPTQDIIIHNTIPNSFSPSAIHLIPVFLASSLLLKADLFISTFALSEATDFLQNTMLTNRFYSANYCYIVGQLNGWGNENFVNHNKIIKGMRTLFKNILCTPFHHGLVSDLGSYEILGKELHQ